MNTPTIRKVLLTGLAQTCKKAAQTVRGCNAEPVIFPLQKTVALNLTLNKQYDWVIFTSPKAVQHFFENDRNVTFTKSACVGPSTQKALLDMGVVADLMPDSYNAASLAVKLKKEVHGLSVLYPCSALADSTIEEALSAHCNFHRVDLYRPEKNNQKECPEFTDAVFFSSSGVEVMYEYFGSECLKGKKVAAIGGKTAATLQKLFGIKPITPSESTAESTIKELLAKAT